VDLVVFDQGLTSVGLRVLSRVSRFLKAYAGPAIIGDEVVMNMEDVEVGTDVITVHITPHTVTLRIVDVALFYIELVHPFDPRTNMPQCVRIGSVVRKFYLFVNPMSIADTNAFIIADYDAPGPGPITHLALSNTDSGTRHACIVSATDGNAAGSECALRLHNLR
jgi:hypothetical protein